MASKLDKVLELLINEENGQAEKLLHDYIVSKARSIHESIVANEEEEFDLSDDSEDFSANDELSSDADEIDAEETFEGEEDYDDEMLDDEDGEEMDFDMDMDSAEGDLEGMDDMDMEDDADTSERLDNVEDALANLQSEFESIMGDDDEESGDEDFSFEDEDEMDVEDEEEEDEEEYDDLEESAKLSKVSPKTVEKTVSKSNIAKPKLDAVKMKANSKTEAGGKVSAPGKKMGTDNQKAKLAAAQKAKNEKTSAKSMGFGKGAK